MNNRYLKPILGGIAIGAVLYFLPFYFIGKVFFILLVVFLLFRLFRHRSYYRGPYNWQFADKIRSMNDQDYNAFKENFRRRCGDEEKSNTESND